MPQVSTTVSTRDVGSYLDQQVADRMQAAGGRVRDVSKAVISQGRPGSGPAVDSGRMRNAMEVTTERHGTELRTTVACRVEHALPQHEGTGVHGPEGQPIRPRRARVLRFRGRGGAFVFRPEVEGVTPLRFLTIALERLRTSDF